MSFTIAVESENQNNVLSWWFSFIFPVIFTASLHQLFLHQLSDTLIYRCLRICSGIERKSVKGAEETCVKIATEMRHKPSLNTIGILHRHYISNNIFVRILFDLIVTALFLLIYLVLCKYMSTTIRINGTVQFTAIMEKHMRQWRKIKTSLMKDSVP